MSARVDCEGAPRDLGFAQGRACAALLRERFGSEGAWRRLRWHAGRREPATVAAARDLARHFPQQAEALEGVARGARVPAAWLADVQHAALARGERDAVAAAGAHGETGFAARSLAGPVLVRRQRPEGGLCFVDVTHPWLGFALAGVNEAGIALAVVWRAAPAAGAAPAAAPLAQDCLQRFDSLEASLDWCVRRPAGGRARVLVADARGEVAGVEIDGAARRVLRPADALLVDAGEPARDRELAKRLRDAPGPPGPGALGEGPLVRVDPSGRRLALFEGSAEPEWTAL